MFEWAFSISFLFEELSGQQLTVPSAAPLLLATGAPRTSVVLTLSPSLFSVLPLLRAAVLCRLLLSSSPSSISKSSFLLSSVEKEMLTFQMIKRRWSVEQQLYQQAVLQRHNALQATAILIHGSFLALMSSVYCRIWLICLGSQLPMLKMEQSQTSADGMRRFFFYLCFSSSLLWG